MRAFRTNAQRIGCPDPMVLHRRGHGSREAPQSAEPLIDDETRATDALTAMAAVSGGFVALLRDLQVTCTRADFTEMTGCPIPEGVEVTAEEQEAKVEVLTRVMREGGWARFLVKLGDEGGVSGALENGTTYSCRYSS